jgi:hypothetical protein
MLSTLFKVFGGRVAVGLGAAAVFVGASLLAVVGAIVVATLLCVPFEWAWDNVMPQVFELTNISLGQAWYLLFGSTLLFSRSGNSSSNKDDD